MVKINRRDCLTGAAALIAGASTQGCDKEAPEAMIDEKTGKRKIFFNLGPKNDWRKILDKKNKEKIEEAFTKEMEELGYI